jgi:hypothetical protein
VTESYHDYAYAERIGELCQLSGGATAQTHTPPHTPRELPRRAAGGRRHHNPYWELETLGSVALLDVIPLDRMKHSGTILYLHLLRWAKRAKANPFPAYTGDLLLDTGMSRNSLTQAREELVALGLIRAEEKPGSRGVWSYELRNPVTGGALPNRERVVYSEVSDWVALEFYRRLILGGQSESGAFACPACARAGTVHVTLSRGTAKHGRWVCRKCHRYGGFREWYAMVHGCDRQMATRGVRAMLQSLSDEESNTGHLHKI